MNVFDLQAKIALDSSEYEKGLDDASVRGSSMGSEIASGFKIVGAAAVAAFGVASAAAVSLTKSAVSSYAQYEQLVGGVDKLFGDASGKLQEYANNAYMTSGLSANAYMEQATSFSAALINSLGGDTQKAADMTDVAMRAMSDNINTFGSDAASVQNAFQGFAKGNYTMLDNLKLGYAGTQEGMKKLIDDANEYAKSIGQAGDLSMDSFADIVQAVELIQEKQGIAGTTQKEAMKTIEGSAAATKAAWENVITAIGRGGEGLDQAFEGLKTSLFGGEDGGGLLNNLIPAIEGAMTALGDFIVEAAPMLGDKFSELFETVMPALLDSALALFDSFIAILPGMIQTVIESIVNLLLEHGADIINSGLELITSLITGFSQGLPMMIPAIIEIITNIVLTLIQNIPMLITAGLQLIQGLGQGLLNALPVILTAIIQIVTELLNMIINNLPMFLEMGIQLIFMMMNGLLNALPQISTAMIQLLLAVIQIIVNNLPLFLQQGIQLVVKIAAGLINAIPKILSAMSSMISQAKTAFTSIDWGELGRNLIQGIANGIRNAGAAIKDALFGAAKKAMDAVKAFFKIGSPSKRMRDEVGKWIPKGVAVGIEENLDDIDDAFDDIDTMLSFESGFDTSVTTISDAKSEQPVQSVNYGDIVVNIYSTEHQDERKIADVVIKELEYKLSKTKAAFA